MCMLFFSYAASDCSNVLCKFTDAVLITDAFT